MENSRRSDFHFALRLIASALLCAAFGLLSHQFLDRGEFVDLWRPAAGLGLAIILLGGPRYAAAVLAGTLLAEVSTHGYRDGVAMALSGVIGPLLGAWLLRGRTSFDSKLLGLKDYLRLMGLAGVLATLGSVLVGVGALLILGSVPLAQAPHIALRWWMGDLLGVALITPLVLVWWRRWRLPPTNAALLESILLVGLTFFAGQAVFLDWFTDQHYRAPVGYWMFLFVGWAALRLERLGVTLILLIIVSQALVGVYLGIGFFGNDLETTGLAGFWRYMMVLAFGGMALATFATERRLESESLIQQSLTLRDHALDKVQEGVTLGNPNRELVYVNEAFLRLTGYSREELLNQSCGKLLQGPNTDPETTELLRKTLGAGQPFHAEILNYRKDGTPFWNDLSITPLFNAQGVLTEYFGVQRDITDQKEALLQLKLREANLKLSAAVLQQSREGVIMTDAQPNILMVNQSIASMTGYTEAELMGQHPNFLVSEQQSQGFSDAIKNAINTLGHWKGEVWIRHKDGSTLPTWLAVSVLRDEQGAVTHYVGNLSDLSEAKAAENHILKLSHYDSVTGLPNRVLLDDRAKHGISMAHRSGETLTMMLVGIDHFRVINETVGRAKGDALLGDMAKRITTCVRDQDTVGRMGGKEFVLLLPSTSSSGAAHLASELLWKLAEPYDLGDQETTLTVSIGIAHYPDNGTDFDTLFKSATLAMHRAQAEGRDTFQFYSDEMYQRILVSDALTKALRQALKLDQLHLVYQPLVDLQTGQVSGLEALLRWTHPEKGSISPAEFIPLAEKSGLIKGIGEWVIRRACKDIRHWLNQGIAVPHVAVNVSPIQFHDPDLIAHVKSAMADWGIAPEHLHMEVTESALMDNVGRSEAMLKELKELGLQLSLDDFGTGYSSLSYLKRFPFDKVKIDRSFVTDIATNSSDQVIARVIISMAHGLGLKVIAEGVETEAQCELLRTSVCDEIQGYLFSKPLSTLDIEKLFSENKQLPQHLLRLQPPKNTLLLVDDEPNVLSALKRLLRRDGYEILTANSGAEGLEVLATNKVDVIISDQRMPGMTGVEFLRAAKVSHPDTIRIVLSGYTELNSVTEAINEGAIYRFLTKPWEDDQLRAHIQQAFDYKKVITENQMLDIKIKTANQQLVAANRHLDEALLDSQQKIERNETSLEVVREALQIIPIPMIGLDDEGLVAFTNAASEAIFEGEGSLLCSTLRESLPSVDEVIASLEEGATRDIKLNDSLYQLTWKHLGMGSRTLGKMITLTPLSGEG